MSVAVGLIYVAPPLVFIISQGDRYQGIPMMQTNNEDSYLARINEILDGHYLVASPEYWEYKDQMSLTPPAGEALYALAVKISGLSLARVMVASKFILPALLFFLVYVFIYRVLNDQRRSAKLSALAGATLVTLGYDLIDYRTVLKIITQGPKFISSFLLWSRPVNPILGAIFLFSFLIGLNELSRQTRFKRSFTTAAAIALAFMFGSYFFSWATALSVVFFWAIFSLLKKEYLTIKRLAKAVCLGLLLATPYWYITWRAAKSPWYLATALRNGLFLTHYPLLNKFLLLSLAGYVLVIFIPALWQKQGRTWCQAVKVRLQTLASWHITAFALLFAGLLVYTQQIFTGRTIWPYHFVQYTIPLTIVAFIILWHHEIGKWSRWLWGSGLAIIFSSSLLFGIITQTVVYQRNYREFTAWQADNKIFAWFNQRPRDAVVLVSDNTNTSYPLENLLLAFTHVNLYSSNRTFSLMPEERLLHSFLVDLRMQGYSVSDVRSLILKNRSLIDGRLYTNWEGLFGVTADFPDFRDFKLEDNLRKLPAEYRQFLKQDFKQELLKYRLDYILSVGPMPKGVAKQLAGLKLEYQYQNIFIYSL